jgi:hypothetical protein
MARYQPPHYDEDSPERKAYVKLHEQFCNLRDDALELLPMPLSIWAFEQWGGELIEYAKGLNKGVSDWKRRTRRARTKRT